MNKIIKCFCILLTVKVKLSWTDGASEQKFLNKVQLFINETLQVKNQIQYEEIVGDNLLTAKAGNINLMKYLKSQVKETEFSFSKNKYHIFL